MKKKILTSALAAYLTTTSVLAHTNSIGYVGDGNGGLNFYYGSWHDRTQFNEAEIKITRPDGTTSIDAFNLLEQDSPAGLLSGVNFFTSDGTQLVPYDPNTPHPMGMPNESYTWQGLNYTNLVTGQYTFTYIPLGDPESNLPGSPTAEWMPMDEVIRSLTINLTNGDLTGDANLNGILDINEVASGAASGAPTVVSTSAGTPIISTSSIVGTTLTTAAVTYRTEEDQTNQTLETTVTTTRATPTTTTTCTTPTTVTTYSDSSTTTTNGSQSCQSVVTTDTTSSYTSSEMSGRIDQIATLTDMSRSFIRDLQFDNVNIIRGDNEYDNGMEGDTEALTAGFKRVTDGGTIVGLGIANIDTKINDTVNYASMDSDVVSATVGKQLENINIEVKFTHFNNDYSYNRTIGSSVHQASTKGSDTLITATLIGRNETFQPILGITRAKYTTKGYSESGSSITARNVSSTKEYDTYGIIGGKWNIGSSHIKAIRYTDGVEQIGVGITKSNDTSSLNVGIDRTDTGEGTTDTVQFTYTKRW